MAHDAQVQEALGRVAGVEGDAGADGFDGAWNQHFKRDWRPSAEVVG
jgi:hypothetical protein